ncbi:hypothetical protein V0R50_20365 [Pseudomonas sp. 148P]|uniref:Uncharacterized protein n=1 Tax=Pseudomonas ulcerans TaxID=3115852 RepID=A0ABU7HVT8_9PSED|nr:MULTISPECIES: hypothetical protein [unclassified Pseudomonas]MEE1926272.1 hypothetical protein [Pseudomonas sp. 147P]MEE1935594.1 hypothetical protein [Pseudomonas sp. 148P]
MTMGTTDQPLVNAEGEVREMTSADFKRARKASETFPPGLQVKLGMRDGGSTRAKRATTSKK